jgi:formylglycine-generating enzyme required for sulfatase activity
MGKYEVTQGQWRRIMGRNDAYYAAGRTLPENFRVKSKPEPFTETHPIELIDWYASMRFCTRLGMTLPHEVDWEYGCRAGTTSLWFWGDKEECLKDRESVRDEESMNVIGPEQKGFVTWNDGFPVHAPVGTFEPNGWGLFDMHGNVGEWCLNPAAQGHWLQQYDVIRYIRGGSWNEPATYWSCSAWRTDRPRSEVFTYVGLRVARALDP